MKLGHAAKRSSHLSSDVRVFHSAIVRAYYAYVSSIYGMGRSAKKFHVPKGEKYRWILAASETNIKLGIYVYGYVSLIVQSYVIVDPLKAEL